MRNEATDPPAEDVSGPPSEPKTEEAGPTPSSDPPGTAPDPSATNRDRLEPGGPLGRGGHVVREGECLSSIAEESGHLWETIWNHAANRELKEVRGDPNVLLPEDRVTIPTQQKKTVKCATDRAHRFRRKGVPAKVRIRLMEEPADHEDSEESEEGEARTASESTPEPARPDVPRSNVQYSLEVDGRSFEGTTDGEGYLEVRIPASARLATLTIEPGTPDEETVPLRLGGLDPLSETSGVKQRLNNLGFDCGDVSAEETDAFRAALRAFKVHRGLPDDDTLDRRSREELRKAHGS